MIHETHGIDKLTNKQNIMKLKFTLWNTRENFCMNKCTEKITFELDREHTPAQFTFDLVKIHGRWLYTFCACVFSTNFRRADELFLLPHFIETRDYFGKYKILSSPGNSDRNGRLWIPVPARTRRVLREPRYVLRPELPPYWHPGRILSVYDDQAVPGVLWEAGKLVACLHFCQVRWRSIHLPPEVVATWPPLYTGPLTTYQSQNRQGVEMAEYLLKDLLPSLFPRNCNPFYIKTFQTMWPNLQVDKKDWRRRSDTWWLLTF